MGQSPERGPRNDLRCVSGEVPAEVDAIVAAIQAAIDKLPLHEDEAKDIVEYTYYETQEVREAFLSDTWSDATAAAADRAFQLLLTIPWTHSEEMTQTEKASVTHADLNRHVGAVDSDAVWSRTRDKHVTPLRDAFELPVNWEAELSGSFESLSVSALRNHLRPIIPTQLSAIWHLVLKGHSPTLDAPAGVLGTKLAVPSGTSGPAHMQVIKQRTTSDCLQSKNVCMCVCMYVCM